MEFEFDPAKTVANKQKHGIDFEEAQALWNDPNVLEAPARPMDEPRYLAIGMIGARYWSAIVTKRAEKIRVISMRRARQSEIERYEGE